MNNKVLLVGWDAADWKVITPLMDRGLMPATRSLVESGVSGQMATLSPVLSPMLWTSIATGKRPYKHGILGFTEPSPASGIQPITNLSRKTKAVWNILNQNGLRCNVVGWWPSHPAEPINGVMVSNHYHQANGPLDGGWPIRPGTVYPAHLAETLADLRVHPEDLDPEGHILPFIPKAPTIDQDKDRRLETCAKIIAECASIQSCATHLIGHGPWDFMAVYFDAIDHFSHAFMRYHPPQQDWISDDDFDLYQNVVSAGYVFHDMMLARLLELAGSGVTVILMSDHGFHPDHQRRRTLPSEPAGPAAEHRDFGIFVMRGPGIKRDELVHGVGLLDVTPTILTLFGLPVGEDMDGRPLVGAFEQHPSITSIPSWDAVEGDDGRHPPDRHLTAADAREGIEQLVALGYIERPSDNIEQAVRDTVGELDYNLARSYMDGGQHGNAVPLLFKLYEQKPLEFRFGIQLAICLQTLGATEDLARVIDHLNACWRRAAEEAKRRLAAVREIVQQRRAALPAADAPAAKNVLSPSELDAVRKLGAIARGNPSTLDYLAGWVAAARRQHEQALAHYKHAEKSESRVPGFHLQLGDGYIALERYAEAETCFRRVFEIDPVSPGAHLGLAKMHLGKRQPKQALEHATRAIGLRHYMPAAHYYVGMCRLALRQFDDAIAAFETALAQNPNFPEAHARLARIYSHVRKDITQAAMHRAQAGQIRDARRRQAKSRVIAALPDIAAIDYEAHLPSLRPVAAEGRMAALSEPPAADERALRDRNADANAAVVVVSGLPRSGTSMMMQMLVAGGIQPLTDGERVADESNPRGYLELAKVKQLQQRNDWLDEARGRCVKIVAPLVPHLPQRVSCRVIVMDRDLDEIVASQHRMLERDNQQRAKLSDEQLKAFLRQQLTHAARLLTAHEVPMLVIRHTDVLTRPAAIAQQVVDFLGRPLDVSAMAHAVDVELYRERATDAAIAAR
jgi:tetratricopeptide (TPR) repeat protein